MNIPLRLVNSKRRTEKWPRPNSPGGRGGLLPDKRLMGVCHWMGSHFHNWIDYNGDAFSIKLLEWGRRFLDFWGKASKSGFKIISVKQ